MDDEKFVKDEFRKFDLDQEWSNSIIPMLGQTCSVKTKLKIKDKDIIAAISLTLPDGGSQNKRWYFPKTVLKFKENNSNDESNKKFILRNRDSGEYLSTTSDGTVVMDELNEKDNLHQIWSFPELRNEAYPSKFLNLSPTDIQDDGALKLILSSGEEKWNLTTGKFYTKQYYL